MKSKRIGIGFDDRINQARKAEAWRAKHQKRKNKKARPVANMLTWDDNFLLPGERLTTQVWKNLNSQHIYAIALLNFLTCIAGAAAEEEFTHTALNSDLTNMTSLADLYQLGWDQYTTTLNPVIAKNVQAATTAKLPAKENANANAIIDPQNEFLSKHKIVDFIISVRYNEEEGALEKFIKHIKIINNKPTKLYADQIAALVNDREEGDYISIFEVVLYQNLTQLVNRDDINSLKVLFEFYKKYKDVLSIKDWQVKSLVKEAIENQKAKILEVILSYNSIDDIGYSTHWFNQKLQDHLVYENPAMRVWLFKNADKTIKKLLFGEGIPYEDKMAIIKNTKINNLLGGNVIRFYSKQLDKAIASGDLGFFSNVVNYVSYNKFDGEWLFEYVVNRPEMTSKLIELSANPGNTKQFLFEKLHKSIQDEVNISNVSKVNKLLVFHDMHFDMLKTAHTFNRGVKQEQPQQLDWSGLNSNAILSDEAAIVLFKTIKNQSSSAAKWLVLHFAQAEEAEQIRLNALIDKVYPASNKVSSQHFQQKTERDVFYDQLSKFTSVEIRQAMQVGDKTIVKNLLNSFGEKIIRDFWDNLFNISDSKQMNDWLDFILNYHAAQKPVISPYWEQLTVLVKQHNNDMLKQFFNTWPDLCNPGLILNSLDIKEHEMAEFLLDHIPESNQKVYVHYKERSFSIIPGKRGNRQATTLMHECAKRNEIEFAKKLIERGAVVDYQFHGSYPTPLLLACENGNFEFASMLIDYYIEKNIPITEELALNAVSFTVKAYERAISGKYLDAAKVLFFRAKNFTTFEIGLSAIFSVMLLMIAGLVACVKNERDQRKVVSSFFNKAIQQLKTTVLSLSTELKEYLDEIEFKPELKNLFDACRSGFSHEITFPIAFVMSDGQNYDMSEGVDKYFERQRVSMYNKEPITFSSFRFNINLVSCVKHILTKQIESDTKLSDSTKFSYLKELEEIAKKNKLLASMDDCVKDPNTGQLMKRPCIAPNGLSYQVDTQTTETQFKTKIPGLGEVEVYRNFALESLIDQYKAANENTTDNMPRNKIT